MLNKFFISLLLLLSATPALKAFHIVGGVITYKYNSGTNYTVTMKIYRDCAGGGAGFDDPACIGVFEEATGAFVDSISLSSPSITNLPTIITNPCMVPPAGICVEEGVYVGNYSFPDATKSYLLVYQRCCRNTSVDNLSSPSSQGATYTARVPRTDLYHNSSATYNSFPPLFICEGAPLVFNHSATDIDGDSLYYSACAPFTGGTSALPMPRPPSAPPYSNVTYVPPYSYSNPMGGTFAITPNTGVLTATPPTIGQFVVGICVSEFRDGVWLNTTLRDFQFNVTTCNIPVANIPSFDIDPSTGIGYYAVNCNNYLIDFVQASSGAISYYWDFGDPGSTSDTSRSIAPSYTYPDTGTYLVTLIATNAVGCKDTAYAYVLFYPIFTPGFTFDERCLDSAIVFLDTSSATTSTVNSWYWNFGDGDTSSAQNPSHIFPAAGSYYVSLHVTTDKGCEEDVLDTVTVYPLPDLSFTTGPTCVNTPVSFTNTSSGAIISYEWFFGDGSSSTSFSPTHTYTSPGNKTIKLVAVTDHNCKDTLVRTITIHALPIINIEPDDTLICDGSPVRLVATAGMSTYSWFPPTDLSSTTVYNPLASPSGPITYFLIATDANGCSALDSAHIGFFPPPVVNAGPDTSICLSPGSYIDSVQLNGFGLAAVSYSWSPATGLNNSTIPNPVSHPTANTTYVLTVVDLNGCVGTDSVRVTVLDPTLNLIVAEDSGLCKFDSIQIPVADQGVLGYTWTPALYISDITIRQPYFYPRDSGLFILTISNYCYTKSDSIWLDVYPLPIVDCGDLDSVCFGESYQLLATGAESYLWDSHPDLSSTTIPDPIGSSTTTTWYKVIGTDSLGCQNRDSIRIIVYPLPNVSITPVPSVICLGDIVPLNASGGVWYAWSPNINISDTTLPNPVATAVDTITYHLMVTNIHQCVNYDSVQLNVQLPIVPVVDPFFEICQRDVAVLNVSGGLYFQWYPDYNLDNPWSPTPSVFPDTSFTYYVRVSNDCFADTASTFVLVHPLPTVSGITDTTIFRGQSVRLYAEGGTSYSWWPNTSLDNGFIQNPLATPLYTTAYVTFITDEFGCNNSDSVIVHVISLTKVIIPTAFSPNADGVNDLFRPLQLWNIEHLDEFSVYNRWGEKVFSSDRIENGWDGTYKTTPQDVGVYVWFLKGKTYEGEAVLEHGNVTLIR